MEIYFADGSHYTVEEIRKRVPELRGLSLEKVTSLVTEMYRAGLIRREVRNRTAYFFIEKVYPEP